MPEVYVNNRHTSSDVHPCLGDASFVPTDGPDGSMAGPKSPSTSRQTPPNVCLQSSLPALTSVGDSCRVCNLLQRRRLVQRWIAQACFVLIMKSSASDMKPADDLFLLFLVIRVAMLLPSVKQNVALLSVLPCQTPTDTSYSGSCLSLWFPLSCIAAFVPPFTSCEAHSGANCEAWHLTSQLIHTHSRLVSASLRGSTLSRVCTG